LTNSRRVIDIVAVVVAAAAVGATAAVALSNNSSHEALGATHCTRYAPSQLPVDTNCGTKSTGVDGSWQTSGIAFRISNVFESGLSRSWQLWYSNTGITAGVGTFGSIGSTPGQTYADCSMSGGSINMRCSTDWQ
jgi:hypothetical protein